MLQEFKQKAIWAHNWTSFDPEKRGEQLISEFTEVLTNDLKEIETADEETKARFISKWKSLFSSWLGAKSNCYSAMITGPANFNNRKHEKANNREHNHYEAFKYWREKAKKAILKSLEPEKTYESELDRLTKELVSRQTNQQLMKDCNAIIRKAKGADCTALLVAAGLSEANAKEVQQPGRFTGMGFAQFQTTNNLASIHRIEERIAVLSIKSEKADGEQKEFIFAGGKVVLNYEIDRVQIIHDAKPSHEELTALKAKGLSSFNFSFTNKAWQMKITRHAISKANEITGLQINTNI
jgi:hypothetical protein